MERIIVEFIHGDWDGMNLCSFSEDSVEASLARQVHSQVGGQGLGAKVTMPSHYALRASNVAANCYVLTDRTRVAGELLIRLECFADESERVESLNGVAADPRVILQFRGGILDGIRLDSQSAEYDEALAATALLLTTDRAAVGAQCPGIPMAAWRMRKPQSDDHQAVRRAGQTYRVAARSADEGQVIVTLEYCSKPSPDE